VNRTLGVILIVLGIIGLVWGGLTYTTQKKVLDIGPVEAYKSERHALPVPPIAGAVALIGGLVLLATGRQR
jgi:drug/metabolite transporter (DMT)-like permease